MRLQQSFEVLRRCCYAVQTRHHVCPRATTGRRGRRGRQGPPGPTCANPVRSAEWVCPVTKLFAGRRKPCDDYACECRVSAMCPKGYYASSCLCSNTNPLTPVDLGPPLGADASLAGGAGSTLAGTTQGYGAPELDLRYPWVLTSTFNAFSGPDGPNPQGVTECACTWVNTIPLVSRGGRNKVDWRLCPNDQGQASTKARDTPALAACF